MPDHVAYEFRTELIDKDAIDGPNVAEELERWSSEGWIFEDFAPRGKYTFAVILKRPKE